MELDKFYGINNQQKPTEYGYKGAQDALNVDITDGFKVVRRNGKTKLTDVAIEAACATGEGEVLYQRGHRLICMSRYSTGGEKVAVGLSQTHQLTCSKINDQVIWSNGANNGAIDLRTRANFTLGIKTPQLPSITITSGHMPVGQYLYTITLVRSDGLESGAPMGGQLQLDGDGGVIIEAPQLPNTPAFPADGESDSDLIPSADNKIDRVRLYLTHANGSELYYAGEYPLDSRIEYKGDTLDLSHVLENQFCDQPPPFSQVCFYRGSMYYADGNTLYASKPFNFGMVDHAVDYVQFESPITMLTPSENGLYVATENETSFLAGATIGAMTRIKVLDYGAIRGVAKRVFASTIVPNQSGNVSLWPTNRGLVAGFDGGQVTNLTEQYFTFPDVCHSTSALREENGLRQLIVTLK